MPTPVHRDSDADAAPRAAARERLNRAWFIFLAAAAMSMGVMFGLLRGQWRSSQLKGWALITALAFFYELRIFKQTLPLMRFPGEERLSDHIGPSGVWSLVAGLGYGLLTGLLMVPQPAGWMGWMAVGLGLAAIAADAEAYRRSRQGPILAGERYLAGEMRALGALAVTVVAIHYGKLPSWFLVVGLMEYLLLFTAGWMKRKKETPFPVDPRLRTLFLYVYLAGVSVGMAPVIRPEIARPWGMVLGVGYFLAALRDWLVTSGHWRRGAAS